uniref:Cathepsin 7 n=1 Tax=Cacopsylla melanoneura TaxID=428564 RepID=A0A8D9FCL7_9HEMI
MNLMIDLNYFLICILSLVFGQYQYDDDDEAYYSPYYPENDNIEYAYFGNSYGDSYDTFSSDDEKYFLKYRVHDSIPVDETLSPGIPASYDWRVDFGFNVVPPAESQGTCYTCWIFGSVYMLEAQYAIKTGKAISFSKQQILDCVIANETGGCSGMGSLQLLIDYVKRASLQTTESYGPYLDLVDTCHYDPNKVSLGVTGEPLVFSGHEEYLEAVYHRGPIVVMMQSNWEQTYGGGIVSVKGEQCNMNDDSKPFNHLVLIVGYGMTAQGKKYWIGKNTHGRIWGLDGYFKIERGKNTLCIEHLGWISQIILP